MIGFGANRRGGRLSSFIFIALLVIIGILSFNNWTVSSKHARLQEELVELQAQVKRTETARSRLEKRNSELMLQADNNKREMLRKEDDHLNMGNQIQAKDNQLKKCEEEKVRVQNNVSGRLAEIQQLQEQLAELRQEFLKLEDQIHDHKKNSTFLEKKLEYESVQCGQQISELKQLYEEKLGLAGKGAPVADLKNLNSQANMPRATHMPQHDKEKVKRESLPDALEKVLKVRGKDDVQGKDLKHDKNEPVKLGEDAGMPGIEDTEIGKAADPFALKKPAVSVHKDSKQSEKERILTGEEEAPEKKPDFSFGKDQKILQPLQDKNVLKSLNQQNIQVTNSANVKVPVKLVEKKELNRNENQNKLPKEPVMQIPSNNKENNDLVQQMEKALEPVKDAAQKQEVDPHPKQNEERKPEMINAGEYGKHAPDVL
ncbi:protein GOLM2 isoform X2 [Protopterus annectens]|uniref:protein GOLM2 isoform X2 n=1 Tax=Protopterus annectens TaxID=7888 RepID=UPI001CFA5BF1|nr:protein GOLM2 isoform X2 [Protopterus annectens]